MKITIITSSEKRQRYKFISVPMGRLGYIVDIIITSPLLKYLIKIAGFRSSCDKVDAVILIGVGLTVVPAFSICKFKHIPVILRLGGDPHSNMKSKARVSFDKGGYANWLKDMINIEVAKKIMARVDGVIVVNNALKRIITERIENATPIFIVPQYCKGEPVKHNYTISTAVELLSVTNLAYEAKARGVIWLIDQLISFVQTRHAEFIFRVAGSGKHLSDIQQHILASDFPNNLTIHLEGFVKDLNAYYINADVFLYNSALDALPNVILESKRYGVPLLANSCEEFKEIIEHDISGLLYEDAIEFETYLTQVVGNQRIRQKLGTAAQEEHRKRYSIEAVADKIDNSLAMFK